MGLDIEAYKSVRLIESGDCPSGDERGHCKCCCDKWHPVPKPPRRTTHRVYYGPKFDLVWTPRKRCSCSPGHQESTDG